MPSSRNPHMIPNSPDTPSGAALAAQLSAYISGKVVLTTGVAAGGLGGHFVSTIAGARPRLLIVTGRTPAKAQVVADEVAGAHPGVETRVLALDLASQKSVRAAAAEVNAWDDVPAIDVLVLNAGLMGVEYGKTEEGIEMQFGANYVGHWLFGNLIMGKVLKGVGTGANGEKTQGGRVVSVSSDGIRLEAIRFTDYNFGDGESYDKWRAYGQSKTGNSLYAVSLAKKLGPKGIVATTLHPGVIGTNLSAHMGGRTEESFDELIKLDKEQGFTIAGKSSDFTRISHDQGVATHIFASFAPEVARHNGAYCAVASVRPAGEIKAWARDPVDAEKLWALTEELVGQKFEW